MNKIICIIVLLTINVDFVFSQKDFRNVNWGMTMEQVKQNETAPLTGEEKSLAGLRNGETFYNGIDFIYEDVTIAERQARMFYHFKNGKLSEIRVIFKSTVYYKFDEPMSKIIQWFKPLFENFKRKGFQYRYPLQCGNNLFSGPNRDEEKNVQIIEMSNWNINDSILLLIDQMIADKHYKYCFTVLENERTYCNLFFRTSFEDGKNVAPVVMILTPSYNVIKQNGGSDF